MNAGAILFGFGVSLTVEDVGNPEVQIYSEWLPKSRCLVGPLHWLIENQNKPVGRTSVADDLCVRHQHRRFPA